MIKYINIRNKDMLTKIVSDRSVVDACWSMLYYELGYGGKIVSVDKTMVKLRTQILGSVDEIVIEGNEKEMQILLSAIGLYLQTQESLDKSFEKVQKYLGDLAGKPLFLCHASPLIIGGAMGGERRLRVILCSAIGMGEEMKELVEYGMELKREERDIARDEFKVMVELIYGGAKVSEVMSLV